MLVILITVALAAHNEPLQRAWQAWDNMDYGQVSTLLDVAGAQPMSAEESARYLELRALITATYGDRARAEEYFTRLLRAEPAYQPPPGMAPKVLDALEAARARLAAQVEPELEPDPEPKPGPEPEPAETVTETAVSPAIERPWSITLALDGGASILLGDPQSETFETVGPGFGIRAAIEWRWLAAELQTALSTFGERDGDRRTQALWICAGGAWLPALADGVRTGVRAHLGAVQTGSLTRLGFDAAIDLQLELGVVGLGPFVRYAHIVARERDGRARGDARALTAGAQVTVSVW